MTVADDRERIAPHDPHNLFDRLSRESTLQVHYDHLIAREQRLLAAHLRIPAGDVLSVGSGWYPGRHLFPAPAFRLVAVDSDPERVAGVARLERADEVHLGYAGRLDFPPASFDVVLYRLVLHHIAYQGSLDPCFAEAARLLRPGGAMIAIEPGLWHPVGLGLALANGAGLAVAIHGTPDDIPLSPRRLLGEARAVGLSAQLHAVTFTWRRLLPRLQLALAPLDDLGSRPRAARFGHTLMLIARKPR
jgi:SAM-dependent methyltransferase